MLPTTAGRAGQLPRSRMWCVRMLSWSDDSAHKQSTFSFCSHVRLSVLAASVMPIDSALTLVAPTDLRHDLLHSDAQRLLFKVLMALFASCTTAVVG